MRRGGTDKQCDERMRCWGVKTRSGWVNLIMLMGGKRRWRVGGIMLLLAPQLQHDALLVPFGPFLLLRVYAVTYCGIIEGDERD